MSWNLAPESISTVILCIVWVYSRRSNPIPNAKNKLFQISFFTTFCAMFSNILATILLYYLTPSTLVITWIFNTIYFTFTPLMGMAYYFYTIATLYEEDPNVYKYLLLNSIPGIIYVGLVITNPFTHNIFTIDVEKGYFHGPYISSTYIIFFLYCVLSVFLSIFRGKRVQPSTRIILLAFPIVAVLVIGIQIIIPSIMLTGSAATCAMLLIYLYLQNKQISIDHLTKLLNRHEFLKMLDLRIRRDTHFVVMVLSLRQFKHVNDLYGQHNGDAVLAAISTYLKREMGFSASELYRYSGDEFAMIVTKPDDSKVKKLILKLEERMAHPWKVSGCVCVISNVIGIVTYPNTALHTKGLINGIEYAISLAKKGGPGNSVCYCSPELLEKAKRRQTISDLLVQCLCDKSFEIYYQPIFSEENNCYTIAEALLRMNNTPIGNISPEEFIPIAEESGYIVDISYLVLDKVCQCIKRLLENNIPIDGISVNFSAIQFLQKDLIERITQIMESNGIPFSKIKIEITESTLAENTDALEEFMRQMHEMGICIALDDFGTGYSNLTSVVSMPIDIIKLDKSLIWNSIGSERFSIVVQNLTRAFKELGMTLLAEGVETEEQRQFASSCGCSHIQGFLYARPMPEADFMRFLKENSTIKHN